jgi:hypothetical protein
MARILGCPTMLGGSTLADEWARSPLAVSRVSHGLDGEEAEALITPRTIPGVDLEWPLRFLLWYKWRGARCQSPPPLAISIFSELVKEIPFLATDLEVRPAPFPMMASDRDCSKRPWAETPSMMLPPLRPRRRPCGVLLYSDECLSLPLVVTLIPAC